MEEQSSLVALPNLVQKETEDSFLIEKVENLLIVDNRRSLITKTVAGVASGIAVTIVSYRAYRLKSFKKIFESKSLSKDMAYIGILYGAAEISQQLFRRRSGREDGASFVVDDITNVALFGATGAAPFFHAWYRVLDSFFVGAAPLTVVKKVVLDQAVASSSVTALFLIAVPAFEGASDLTGEESLMRKKFVSIYLTGCLFWPLAQIVNFKLVPPHYRVAYLGLAAFLWTNILCFSRRRQ